MIININLLLLSNVFFSFFFSLFHLIKYIGNVIQTIEQSRHIYKYIVRKVGRHAQLMQI